MAVIVEEFPPTDHASGCGFDSLGEVDGRALVTSKDGMDMAVVRIEAGRQLADVGDTGAKVIHGQSMGSKPIQCKKQLYGFLPHTSENDSMDIWSHRENFKLAVKRHRESTGLKLAKVAEVIGIKEQTLKDYLYRKDVKPSLEVLQKAASAFACSVTEFLDDPGATPEGADAEKWSDASERDRVIASAMFADITADQLTEAEKDELFTAYKEAKERILRLRKLQGSGPA